MTRRSAGVTHRATMLVSIAGPRRFRDKRPTADGSPATVYSDELANGRKYLDVLRWHHVELSGRFLAVAEGAIYEIDLFLAGVMVRSYSLVDGLNRPGKVGDFFVQKEDNYGTGKRSKRADAQEAIPR